MRRALFFVLCAGLPLSACDDDDTNDTTPVADASAQTDSTIADDAGAVEDATAPDTGATDTGVADAGATDAGAADWQPVRDVLEAAFAGNEFELNGMTLVVFNAADERVLEHTVGEFPTDQRVALASASKLVTGLVLLRVANDPAVDFDLDDTTGQHLGWTGEIGAITVDQLGAFVSGLNRQAGCLIRARLSLAECVDEIREEGFVDGAPGDSYAYGGSHLQVAARMVEVATGLSWQAAFDHYLGDPLGITDPALRYVTYPLQNIGASNPLVAGGLRATVDEYAPLLALLFHEGRRGDTQLIPAAATRRFRQNPYADAEVLWSPMVAAGLVYDYSFASWRMCLNQPVDCPRISSPGAYGFTPWVDYDAGYYAILGMESNVTNVSVFSARLGEEVAPLIEAAMAP